MMLRHEDIAGPAGRLEAIVAAPRPGPDAAPRAPRAVVVFAHPHPQYGGTMHSKVVYHAAKAFGRIGCATLRFNFRGVGRSEGTFDEGRGEQDDFRAAVDAMTERYPDVPLWTGGYSFGAYVALRVGADDPRAAVLVGVAPPVAAPAAGPRGDYDWSPVTRSRKPRFFIHGEADTLIPLAAMRRFYGSLGEPKELVVIDAADHLFDGHVSEVGDAVEDLLGDFRTGPPR